MKPAKGIQQNIYLASKSICIDFMRAYQEHSVDKMLNYCTPECSVSFKPLGSQGTGKAHVLGRQIWETLIDSFPTIDNTVDLAVVEKDLVRCEVNIRGRQAKDFAGIVCKDKDFDEDHIFIFKVENNSIASIEVDWDHDSFVKQLS